MPPTLTPQAFVAKWHKSELKESAADREHFIDLCRLIGHETPAEADATGVTLRTGNWTRPSARPTAGRPIWTTRRFWNGC